MFSMDLKNTKIDLPSFEGERLSNGTKASILKGRLGLAVLAAVRLAYRDTPIVYGTTGYEKGKGLNGSVENANPFFLIGANNILRAHGLRTAQLSDLEALSQSPMFTQGEIYDTKFNFRSSITTDIGLVLKSIGLPFEYFSHRLAESIPGRISKEIQSVQDSLRPREPHIVLDFSNLDFEVDTRGQERSHIQKHPLYSSFFQSFPNHPGQPDTVPKKLIFKVKNPSKITFAPEFANGYGWGRKFTHFRKDGVPIFEEQNGRGYDEKGDKRFKSFHYGLTRLDFSAYPESYLGRSYCLYAINFNLTGGVGQGGKVIIIEE